MSHATISFEHAPAAAFAPPRARRRNLGGAVVLAAIDDYRGTDEEAHADAARFLYPRTAADEKDFAWAMAVAGDIDAAWLREMLDRSRSRWDEERSRKGSRRARRGALTGCGR